MDAEKEERFRCGVKNYSETAFCVNALKGVTFISTGELEVKDVQELELCQCPERGDLHFYEKNKIIIKEAWKCVNALKGATFISTYLQSVF